MGDPDEPPGRPPPDGGGARHANNTVPDQRAATLAWAGGSVAGGTLSRNFAKIIEEEKRNRNIIELQINKLLVEDENGVMNKAIPLTWVNSFLMSC